LKAVLTTCVDYISARFVTELYTYRTFP